MIWAEYVMLGWCYIAIGSLLLRSQVRTGAAPSRLGALSWFFLWPMIIVIYPYEVLDGAFEALDRLEKIESLEEERRRIKRKKEILNDEK